MSKKTDEKLDETLDGNEELKKDQDNELSPIEWIDSIVEQNQDDVDFIVKAQKVKDLINGVDTSEMTDLQNKVSSLEKDKIELENQNAGLKKKFYDTFMGINETPKDDNFEEIKKEESPLTLNDIESMIKKGV